MPKVLTAAISFANDLTLDNEVSLSCNLLKSHISYVSVDKLLSLLKFVDSGIVISPSYDSYAISLSAFYLYALHVPGYNSKGILSSASDFIIHSYSVTCFSMPLPHRQWKSCGKEQG